MESIFGQFFKNHFLQIKFRPVFTKNRKKLLNKYVIISDEPSQIFPGLNHLLPHFRYKFLSHSQPKSETGTHKQTERRMSHLITKTHKIYWIALFVHHFCTYSTQKEPKLLEWVKVRKTTSLTFYIWRRGENRSIINWIAFYAGCRVSCTDSYVPFKWKRENVSHAHIDIHEFFPVYMCVVYVFVFKYKNAFCFCKQMIYLIWCGVVDKCICIENL